MRSILIEIAPALPDRYPFQPHLHRSLQRAMKSPIFSCAAADCRSIANSLAVPVGGPASHHAEVRIAVAITSIARRLVQCRGEDLQHQDAMIDASG